MRTRLSRDFLFDEGGKPLDADLPFIEDDGRGLVLLPPNGGRGLLGGGRMLSVWRTPPP